MFFSGGGAGQGVQVDNQVPATVRGRQAHHQNSDPRPLKNASLKKNRDVLN